MFLRIFASAIYCLLALDAAGASAKGACAALTAPPPPSFFADLRSRLGPRIGELTIKAGSIERAGECFTGDYDRIFLISHSVLLAREEALLVGVGTAGDAVEVISGARLAAWLGGAPDARFVLVTCFAESVLRSYARAFALLPPDRSQLVVVPPLGPEQSRSYAQAVEAIAEVMDRRGL